MKLKAATSNKPGWFRKTTILFNIVVALLLVLTYLNSYVSPQTLWWLGFLGLSFPLLLIINFFFFVYWLFRWKYWLFISLIAILPGYQFVRYTFSFGTQQLVLKDDPGIIKVMSYNVRIFNLYEYDRDHSKSNEGMLHLIEEQHPHILCLQEFYTSESKDHKNYNIIAKLKAMGYPYYYFENTFTLRKTDHWGSAIFSDFPIIDSGKISFGKKAQNSCCYADLQIHKKKYRIFNMHLQSIHLGEQDYSYLENVKMENDSDLTASKNILRKLKRAFLRRSHQTDLVSKAIAESPYPVIVCGDFNDTPTTYAYSKISQNLKDAFLESGYGIGKTFVGLFPTLRIDFILINKELESLNTQVIKKDYSDHYPIVSYLREK